MGEPVWVDPEPWVEMDLRDLNAAIDCDTPSASMNCSRSSMLVRPLAEFFVLVSVFQRRGFDHRSEVRAGSVSWYKN